MAACGGGGEPTEPPVTPPAGPDLAKSAVTVSRPLLLPGDTVVVTLQVRDAAGQPLTKGGAAVTFSAGAGAGSNAGTFSAAIDHGDGTYSATFVGKTVGPAFAVSSTLDGRAVMSPPPWLRVVGFTRIAAAGLTRVGAVTTTDGFTCGILTNDDVYCWGSLVTRDDKGQLREIGPSPRLFASGYHWVDIVAGGATCLLADDGNASCWIGTDGPFPLQDGTALKAITAGLQGGGCAITVGGAALCWGWNPWGRLGNGTETASDVPVPVSGGLAFAALHTDYSGTCGVTTGGAAYCWGFSSLLGLGGAPPPDSCSGSVGCALTPVAVSGGHTFRPIIATNGNLVCAVTTGNETYCWGNGYLGNGVFGGSTSPVLVSGGHAFTSLAAGDGFHCGTVANDTAYCWGSNHNGNPGNGATTSLLVPTAVAGGHVFLQLAASQDHTCGVAADGNAYCWGGNDKGELGDRSTTHTAVPVRVRLFS